KVILPFLSPILWAVVLCLATWPLNDRIRRTVRGNRTVAALAMTLTLAVVAMAPFAIAFRSLSEEAKVVTRTVTEQYENWPPPIPDWIAGLPLVGPRLRMYWEQPDAARIAARSAEAGQFVAAVRHATVRVVKAIGHGLLQTALSLFVGF